ncbi:Zinc finger, GRF-type [Trema orientale]|uniref:Zinc finger, GRF-type n=1 Tax=Trema orientale TaxID=63057 RepID=A0A2P5EVQ5_TREOI|nr:Zinc finger, GRF-type [Trema orientale]
MEFCKCKPSLPVVVRTLWTNENPGRRFKSCRKLQAYGGCGFFCWVDLEMCERSKRVIPGLLRRIRDLGAEKSSFDEGEVGVGQSYTTTCDSLGIKGGLSCIDENMPRYNEEVKANICER